MQNLETFINITLIIILVIILSETSVILSRTKSKKIKSSNRAILLDTSVLMDGRIIGIVSSGFIYGTLCIPKSVISELQLLADGSDNDKRARARYGLDVVSELQAIETTTVEILDDHIKHRVGVDDQLLNLAKINNASLCTLDFNLNKVAVVEKVPVLNINLLVQAIRNTYLPGEVLEIELTQKGSESGQALGHLPDGTMVVVENAKSKIGKKVKVEIIRSLQTAAGRMCFAKCLTPSYESSKEITKKAKPNSNNQSKVNNHHKNNSKNHSSTKKPITKSPEDNLIKAINQANSN